MTTKTEVLPAPFLQWAGGKRQLLPTFRELFPEDFNNYHEPFLGAGAVFFELYNQGPVANGSLQHEAFLSDSNVELMDCWGGVRFFPDQVDWSLEGFTVNKTSFMAMRKMFPGDLEPTMRAARTIYLNRAGYNGLYRVNKKGRFNVPFGRPNHRKIDLKEILCSASRALVWAHLDCCDFRVALARVNKGDFVYLDSPYLPVSGTANFTAYTPGAWCELDQHDLQLEMIRLHGRGAKLMMSAPDRDDIRMVFEGLSSVWNVTEVKATRSINSKATKRGKITELVIRNYR